MDPPQFEWWTKSKAKTVNFLKTIKDYENCDIRRLFKIVTLDETW